ncbi:MAG: hypothetical protein ASARMPREDX12_007682 [Alectoria sarmentosa]|nr:MAG: hypothetical protein ASARMPREDX12_007682 [Alectoria sarmentosa]
MTLEGNPMDAMATLDSDATIHSIEDGNSAAPKPDDAPADNSHRAILKRKEYKRRRMYKLAFETMLTQFVNMSDSEGSDDLTDSEEELPEQPGAPKSSGMASTNSKQPDEVEEEEVRTEKEVPVNVLYRAEFYHYAHDFRRGQEPRFDRSINDKHPIRTTRTQNILAKSQASLFEITTMYATPAPDTDARPKSKSRSKGDSKPTEVLADIGTYLIIRSQLVLDILRDIVQYYPSVSLQANEFALQEPFCMLLHYRQELTERRDQLKQAASEMTSLDRDLSSTAHEHLAYLTDFVHQRYADALSRELARHRETRAMCTYDWVWLLFRPGNIVYAWDHDTLRAYIVEEHDRQVGQETEGKIGPQTLSVADDVERMPRPASLTITVWALDFDGERLGRCRDTYSIPAFDGEKPILSLPIFPNKYLKHDKRVHQTLSTEEYLIQRGRLFFEMTKRSYMEHHGETLTSPRRTVRGRVMIDTKFYYDDDAGVAPILGLDKPDEHQHIDLGEDNEGRQNIKGRYGHYDDIDPHKCKSMDPEQYLVCHNRIWAFVLKTRQWEHLHVANFRQPDFQVDLIKDLVLDKDAKAMIKALSHRYTMQSETENTWSADFVRNKGEGQIFLLHGKPGVGKTTTAECVAELTRRPLLSLTCGDLGIEPLVVEKELMRWLTLATSWEAVLLLDEADVYLESRISQDLQRNTLVSIFLRALEYYQGLLFLTTNRVGTFDDAFVSRIHVVIHYPDFTNDQRGQIWNIFFNKLERERENIKFTQRTVDYARESKEMQNLGWNGREIRNAFNTAVGLAEYENERDAKQRVVFHARHLEQVVKMSRAFRDYLNSTHGMSQAEQARTYRTRNDYWKGPGDHSVGSGAV